MGISEIKVMSTIERIQAMEMLWDALCHEEKEIESPVWHEKILKERQERFKSGKTKFITLENLKEHFRK
ncbi:MAG: addiction module protein [Candidatus Riflebacteria bacterium]|nr:addiction module protein [Candidatus Riflebacteria bacterium]